MVADRSTTRFVRWILLGTLGAALCACAPQTAVEPMSPAAPTAPQETPAEPPLVLALSPGEDLALALHHLAVRAGWTLIWRNPHDYRIGAAATIEGSFAHILAAVAEAWDASRHPIEITLHPANQVAVVRAGTPP